MAEVRIAPEGARDSEVLLKAFYRFLDLHAAAAAEHDRMSSIRSELWNGWEVKVLTFWSDGAAAEFRRFWDRRRADGFATAAPVSADAPAA